MAKTIPDLLPQSGGSYIRDDRTGTLTAVEKPDDQTATDVAVAPTTPALESAVPASSPAPQE